MAVFSVPVALGPVPGQPYGDTNFEAILAMATGMAKRSPKPPSETWGSRWLSGATTEARRGPVDADGDEQRRQPSATRAERSDAVMFPNAGSLEVPALSVGPVFRPELLF